MEQGKNYYKRFVKEGFDENGILNKFEIDCPDNYNFGYDIIDKFGEIDPDRRALIHIDLQENRHDFSYSQLSKLSTQAANLFKSYGIKKGDKVMLVLKRNYQFWIAIIALIKLGAVAIPATHLLTTHDFTYRFERASVKAIVCTGYNPDIAKYVDEAQEEIHADDYSSDTDTYWKIYLFSGIAVTDSGKNSPHIHVITKEDLYRFLLDNPNQNPIVNAYREKLQKWYTFS